MKCLFKHGAILDKDHEFSRKQSGNNVWNNISEREVCIYSGSLLSHLPLFSGHHSSFRQHLSLCLFPEGKFTTSWKAEQSGSSWLPVPGTVEITSGLGQAYDVDEKLLQGEQASLTFSQKMFP